MLDTYVPLLLIHSRRETPKGGDQDGFIFDVHNVLLVCSISYCSYYGCGPSKDTCDSNFLKVYVRLSSYDIAGPSDTYREAER